MTEIMETARFYAGSLLLAMPGIGDPRFERAVIAMCAHDDQGALGINLGQEVEGLGLRQLLKQFDIDPGEVVDAPILMGGPVEPQRGFVLHTLDWGGQGMLHVGNRWGLSGSMDVLRAIASGKGPARYIVALGYAGWGEAQLEEEMTRHGWFIAQSSETLLYETAADHRWSASWSASGVDPRLLASQSGSA